MTVQKNDVWAARPIAGVLLATAYFLAADLRPGGLWFILKILLYKASLLQFAAFATVLCFCICSFLLFFDSLKPIGRRWLLASLFPFLWASLTYRFAGGYSFAYHDVGLALSEPSFGLAALWEYKTQTTAGFVLCLAACVLFYTIWPQTLFVKIKKTPTFFLFCSSFLLVYWQIDDSNGNVSHFPSFFRAPAVALHILRSNLADQQRQEVKLPLSGRPQTDKLFLIVDESINGNMLSINGYKENTTPFLDTCRLIANLGTACSFTNYSGGSNLALMAGATQNSFPDTAFRLLEKPTLFQYAKAAGYKTYFIDCQTSAGELQNFMTRRDLVYIDSFIQPADRFPDYWRRDNAAADILRQILAVKGKVFVYLNKAGAHWPYPQAYPPSHEFYKPVLGKSDLGNDLQKNINAYQNALRWSVDGFWERLLKGYSTNDFENASLIYTSDHGQAFQREAFRLRHASSYQTDPQEGNVPLWYVGKGDFLPDHFKNKAQPHHERIFPGLMFAMGYSLPDSLNAAAADRRFWFGDVFGRGHCGEVALGARLR